MNVEFAALKKLPDYIRQLFACFKMGFRKSFSAFDRNGLIDLTVTIELDIGIVLAEE